MALLAMNWRQGKPPRNFVGFAIEFREPATSSRLSRNRIGFTGQRTKFSDLPIDSTMAPFQYFRWVHFPKDTNLPGTFRRSFPHCAGRLKRQNEHADVLLPAWVERQDRVFVR